MGLIGVVGLAYYLYTHPASSASTPSASASAAVAPTTTPAAADVTTAPAATVPATDTAAATAETAGSTASSATDDSSASASSPASRTESSKDTSSSGGVKGAASTSASGSTATGKASGQTYTGKATFYTVRDASLIYFNSDGAYDLLDAQQNGVAGGTHPISSQALPSLTPARSTACGKVNPDSAPICALRTETYAGGKNCGKMIRITRTSGKGGSVDVQVADMCPSCVPLWFYLAKDIDRGLVQVRRTGVCRLEYRGVQQARHGRRRMGASGFVPRAASLALT